MAKRRVITEETEGDDIGQDVSADGGADDDLGRVLGELGGSANAVVKVERIRDGKRAEFVDEFPAASFSLKELQAAYGGGEYMLHGLDAKRKFQFRRQVAVASPLVPAAAPAQSAGALDKLAEVMRLGFEQQQALLRDVLTRAPAQSQTNARQDLLQDMVLMKQLMGDGQSPQLGVDKLLEVMKLGVDLAKDAAGGNDGWEGILTKAIDTLGPAVADVLQQRAAPAPVAPAPARLDPHAAQLPASPAPGPTQQRKQEGGMIGLRQAVGFLVERAADGSDPALYADLILDNVDEATIRQVVGAGDPVPRLVLFDVRVKDHAQWFRELGAALLEQLNSDALKPGSDTPAGDGDPGAPA